MLITTLIFYRLVTRDKWRWSTLKALARVLPFLLVDIAFLAANMPKIPHGGWFPLLVGVGPRGADDDMAKGRQLVAARIRRGERPMQ